MDNQLIRPELVIGRQERLGNFIEQDARPARLMAAAEGEAAIIRGALVVRAGI